MSKFASAKDIFQHINKNNYETYIFLKNVKLLKDRGNGFPKRKAGRYCHG